MDEDKKQEDQCEPEDGSPQGDAEAGSNHSRNAPNGEAHKARHGHSQSLRDHWRSSDPLQRWTFMFTGLIALATFCYAAFSGWQLYEMRSSSKDTHALAEAAEAQSRQALAQTIQNREALGKTEELIRETKRSADAAKLGAESAKKAADTGATQLEMSERPWVSADIAIEGPLRFDPVNKQLEITLGFVLKNTGHTPAANVSVDFEFFPKRVGVDPVVEQKKGCDAIAKGLRLGVGFGDTLFPGDRLARAVTTGMSQDAIARARAGPFILPIVAGCIDYQYAFGPAKHHQTGFIFAVYRYDPGQSSALLAIDPSVTLPASSLKLVPWIQHASYAY
jgi:hypothetical protein